MKDIKKTLKLLFVFLITSSTTISYAQDPVVIVVESSERVIATLQNNEINGESPCYGSILAVINDNLNQTADLICWEKINEQHDKKIAEIREEIKEVTKYLVVLNLTNCSVLITKHKGEDNVISDGGDKIISYVLPILPLLPWEKPTINYNIALAVTWQTKSGKWLAGGPTQIVRVGSEETEEKALQYVYHSKKETLFLKEKKGKFNIYFLARPLKTYETDVRDFLKENNISVDY